MYIGACLSERNDSTNSNPDSDFHINCHTDIDCDSRTDIHADSNASCSPRVDPIH